jgi:hypothetical protein
MTCFAQFFWESSRKEPHHFGGAGVVKRCESGSGSATSCFHTYVQHKKCFSNYTILNSLLSFPLKVSTIYIISNNSSIYIEFLACFFVGSETGAGAASMYAARFSTFDISLI